VCLFVSFSICLFISLSLCLFIFLSLSLYSSFHFFVSLSVYLSVSFSTCLFIYLSLCLCISLSLSLHAFSFICFSVCISLSLSLFAFSFTCLSVCLSLCLSLSLFAFPFLCLSVCLSHRLYYYMVSFFTHSQNYLCLYTDNNLFYDFSPLEISPESKVQEKSCSEWKKKFVLKKRSFFCSLIVKWEWEFYLNKIIFLNSFLSLSLLACRVRINQHNRFPPCVCVFPLPPRASRRGGVEIRRGAEIRDVEQKTVTLIYPYPFLYRVRDY